MIFINGYTNITPGEYAATVCCSKSTAYNRLMALVYDNSDDANVVHFVEQTENARKYSRLSDVRSACSLPVKRVVFRVPNAALKEQLSKDIMKFCA